LSWITLEDTQSLAMSGLGTDPYGHRASFITLLGKAETLMAKEAATQDMNP
jgi:hypothetical protein